MTRWPLLLLLACLPSQQTGQAAPPPQVLAVPARTAYAEPDARAMRRHADGSVTRWKGTLHWFGRFSRTGKVHVALRLAAGAPACKLRLDWHAQGLATLPRGAQSKRTKGSEREADQARADPDPHHQAGLAQGQRELDLGSFDVARVGYHRISLSMASHGKAPGIRALLLSGPAIGGAQFSLVERRNAASVHLGYPLPEEAKDEVEWFYCEVTPRTDPLWTYYEATGWHRGYFGMQVNSPKERRIIFSVWDAGKEPVSRSKVAQEDRVALLAKGEGVHASGFGHEGTGGHSHLVHDWKLGDTLGFLLHARVDGSHTIYTGWCRFPAQKGWRLISSFKAPRDGKRPRGLYSFNENFGGANGHLRRHCEFHDQWVRTTDGKWLPLLRARFTHDGHGRKQRLDRSAGVVGDRFYLANGGFVDDPDPGATTQAYTLLERKHGKEEHPADADLPRLPR